MAEPLYRLVLDAGTTGIKVLVFDGQEKVIAKAHRDLQKSFPQSGWVEQDPAEILSAATEALREVVQKSGVPAADIMGLGISTQRETVVVWDKTTGQPIYPAIVWQDERTADWCEAQSPETKTLVRDKTGLLIDSYFSASKIVWILQHVPVAKELLAKGQLLIGTVDSWLVWNLSGEHVTDYTNASRTLLFNIHTLQWDDELLSLFGVSKAALPEVRPSIGNFGMVKKEIMGVELPILAVCGDQQASLYAAGTAIGTTKVTYGTGTFVMQVIGGDFTLQDGFFTTLAVGERRPWYALEAKATSGVENGPEIVGNPKLLIEHLKKIVGKADAYVQRLPIKPVEVVIDGGWIRGGEVLPIQQPMSHVPVREQIIFDGTALGMARMVQINDTGIH